MSYYQRHIFFCVNERENGTDACAQHGAMAGLEHCKVRIKKEGLNAPGQIRVSKAGCLDRCAGGPVVVVYPEAVWYSFVDTHDVDEIIDSHLKGGHIVERLLLPDSVGR